MQKKVNYSIHTLLINHSMLQDTKSTEKKTRHRHSFLTSDQNQENHLRRIQVLS
ncbi:hypothetical protein Hanom_Chr01g00000311 [Helianthus anomalus]